MSAEQHVALKELSSTLLNLQANTSTEPYNEKAFHNFYALVNEKSLVVPYRVPYILHWRT